MRYPTFHEQLEQAREELKDDGVDDIKQTVEQFNSLSLNDRLEFLLLRVLKIAVILHRLGAIDVRPEPDTRN